MSTATWILVVVYLSYIPGSAPELNLFKERYTTAESCNRVAKLVYQKVKAGQVRAWCWKSTKKTTES